MEQGSVAVARMRLRARDEDEAAGFIQQLYVGQRPRLEPLRGVWADYGIHSVSVGRLRADRVHSSLQFRTGLGAFDSFVFIHMVRGWMSIDDGVDERRLGAGEAGMYRYGEGGYDCTTHDITTAAVCVPFDALVEAADEAGIETGGDPAKLRFTSLAPRSPAAQRSWLALLDHAYREVMAESAAATNPLQNQQLTQAVAKAALATFPNATMTAGHLPGPGRVDPAALRRAVAYIDDNAARPVTLTDIASAAGVGARALQYAFRQHRGMTPMAYLRRVRLHRAHDDLRTADAAAGDTVAAIASRWGFVKPSRFAAYYRTAFGVPPSATLHP